MTARDVRPAGGRWPMPERSVLGSVLGLPPVGAVGLASVLTAVGVFVDLMRIGSLGIVFTVCFVAGCVLAVAWVRRGGLFGPMVQPPLLVGIAVPVIVLLAGTPAPGAGMAEQLLVIGAPLVNAFPIMAWTTGAVLLLGLARLVVQRPLTGRPAKVRPARKSSTAPGKPPAKGSGKPQANRSGKPPATAAEGKKPTGARKPGAERAGADDEDAARPRREGASERRRPGADGARGEGRTSRSPRRS
ncbi:DUF6542 domain-containing protein [Pseudonocardia humida]|uniref:DUF6542 domain-containing protein n=1 Tax=Pseudonocardia humida TaxID=2800819 RepID=A0ABT1A3S7_9PSEU|nr:DUF6542 domain-containing protein [Pseudonocardia humida]MCO1657638.1 hypothetical protein [Pseudonocardia humida]